MSKSAPRRPKLIRRDIEAVITGLTRKRLGFVTRYSAKAPVFSQKLRFPAVFATLACRKQTDHLSVFYQSSQQNHIRRGIEEVITGLTRNQFARKRTWVRIPSSPPSKALKTLGFQGFSFFQISPNRRIFHARKLRKKPKTFRGLHVCKKNEAPKSLVP